MLAVVHNGPVLLGILVGKVGDVIAAKATKIIISPESVMEPSLFIVQALYADFLSTLNAAVPADAAQQAKQEIGAAAGEYG